MHLPYCDTSTKRLQSPHVVILGAGASKAAFPNGDKNSNSVPLMNELVTVLELNDTIARYGLTRYQNDFELLYSHIFDSIEFKELKLLIDKKVENYFSSLLIPNYATLYDYLILSLKGKDLIATFNWDPFLLQAYRRNIKVGNLPKLAFLHGNVGLGVCENDKVLGYRDCICNICKNKLVPVDLLYPVTHKDYNSNPIIKSQWDMLSYHLDIAYFLTIFGYSAPKSDIEAIDIMKKAWKNNGSVDLAQIEVIDIKSRDDVIKSWSEFTVREHYGISNTIKNSWLWQFPRESGEALFDATLQCNPIESIPFPESDDLQEIQEFAQKIKIRDLH